MLTIDERGGRIIVHDADGAPAAEHALDTPEAFAAVSDAWLRCGWDVKYVYGFTWMGRPVIQLPEDMIRIQEVIWRLRPDVVIETGVAHGGSLVFYASLFARDRRRPGDRRRRRDPSAQPRRDRGAPAGPVHHTDRGRLHRSRHRRRGARRGGCGRTGAGRFSTRTTGAPTSRPNSNCTGRWSPRAATSWPATASWRGSLARRARRRTGAGTIRSARWTRSWHVTPSSCWTNRFSRSTKARCASVSPIGRRRSCGGWHEGGTDQPCSLLPSCTGTAGCCSEAACVPDERTPRLVASPAEALRHR